MLSTGPRGATSGRLLAGPDCETPWDLFAKLLLSAATKDEWAPGRRDPGAGAEGRAM